MLLKDYSFNFEDMNLKDILVNFKFYPEKFDIQKECGRISQFILDLFCFSENNDNWVRLYYILNELLSNCVNFSFSGEPVEFKFYRINEKEIIIDFLNYSSFENIDLLEDYVEKNIRRYNPHIFSENLMKNKKGGIGLLTLKENHKIDLGFKINLLKRCGLVTVQAKFNLKDFVDENIV